MPVATTEATTPVINPVQSITDRLRITVQEMRDGHLIYIWVYAQGLSQLRVPGVADPRSGESPNERGKYSHTAPNAHGRFRHSVLIDFRLFASAVQPAVGFLHG